MEIVVFEASSQPAPEVRKAFIILTQLKLSISAVYISFWTICYPLSEFCHEFKNITDEH